MITQGHRNHLIKLNMSFIVRTLNKLGIKGEVFNVINVFTKIYNKYHIYDEIQTFLKGVQIRY